MMKKFKPCPFCGSGDATRVLTIGLKWTVGCNRRGCRTAEYDYSVDAVSAWNRRYEAVSEAGSVDAADGAFSAGEVLQGINRQMQGVLPENIEDVPF